MADTKISELSNSGQILFDDDIPVARSGSTVRVQMTAEPVRTADVAVSSAEILALHTTPKTLVAAPGASKIIEFISAIFFLDYNSAAYAAIAAGDDFAIRYTDASGDFVAGCELTGFLDQTSDQYRISKGYSPLLPDVTGVNAPLILNLSGAITTGDSPVGVRILYRIHDLSTLSAT